MDTGLPVGFILGLCVIPGANGDRDGDADVGGNVVGYLLKKRRKRTHTHRTENRESKTEIALQLHITHRQSYNHSQNQKCQKKK